MAKEKVRSCVLNLLDSMCWLMVMAGDRVVVAVESDCGGTTVGQAELSMQELRASSCCTWALVQRVSCFDALC